MCVHVCTYFAGTQFSLPCLSQSAGRGGCTAECLCEGDGHSLLLKEHQPGQGWPLPLLSPSRHWLAQRVIFPVEGDCPSRWGRYVFPHFSAKLSRRKCTASLHAKHARILQAYTWHVPLPFPCEVVSGSPTFPFAQRCPRVGTPESRAQWSHKLLR